MIKPEIKETPSDTPIATPISSFFFDGAECSDKDVAAAGGELDFVVGAGMLDKMGRFLVAVKVVVVIDCLADCDGETITLLASLRFRPAIIGVCLRSTALSQHPAAASWLPGISLQQNVCVNEPLTDGHGMMLLKMCMATATLSRTAYDSPGRHGRWTRYRFCSLDSIRRHPNWDPYSLLGIHTRQYRSSSHSQNKGLLIHNMRCRYQSLSSYMACS